MDLLCPVCHEKLTINERSYRCLNRHSFDLSRDGYLNLNMKSSQRSGDEKEMIRARRSFLSKDHYLFLRNRLNEIIDELSVESMVDLGCGEGYYTGSFNVQEKIGIDLSKEALKIASKHDKRTLYVLKNIFELPLKDSCTDLVTTVFAPVSREIVRILKDKGHFLLVRPDKRHLYELKEAVYEHPYLNTVEDVEIRGMRLEREEKISSTVLLKNDELIDLFKMTPYYHKTSPQDLNKLNDVDELEVSFSFIIDLYIKEQS